MVSRALIVAWGVVLCAVAQLTVGIARHYGSILDLALAMSQYTAGGLLAGFLLAFIPLRINGFGFLFSAPLSVLTVFALAWHDDWAKLTCWTLCAALLAAWCLAAWTRPHPPTPLAFARKTAILLSGCAVVLYLAYFGQIPSGTDPVTGTPILKNIAWPWYAPIGSIVAFVWGYLLADRRGRPLGDSDQLDQAIGEVHPSPQPRPVG